jgi:hypothetical protein
MDLNIPPPEHDQNMPFTDFELKCACDFSPRRECAATLYYAFFPNVVLKAVSKQQVSRCSFSTTSNVGSAVPCLNFRKVARDHLEHFPFRPHIHQGFREYRDKMG